MNENKASTLDTKWSPDDDRVDVVIPAHIKDLDTVTLCVEYVKKNVKNLNNVYVVSRTKLCDNAIWISEDIFPFTLDQVGDIIGRHWRTCWYFAGLIQTTAALVIPNLLNNVLILDSDTLFIKPVEFVKNGVAQFNISGYDGTQPYYEHLMKLIPGMKRIHKYSGVAHCILMQCATPLYL